MPSDSEHFTRQESKVNVNALSDAIISAFSLMVAAASASRGLDSKHYGSVRVYARHQHKLSITIEQKPPHACFTLQGLESRWYLTLGRKNGIAFEEMMDINARGTKQKSKNVYAI